MMWRWISEVPSAIVPAKLRVYRSNQLAMNASLFMWLYGPVTAG